MLERSNENRHFSHKAAQARKSERCKSGNHISHAEERHDSHQTTHLADVASVCAAINHTDKGKEQCCHQAVRENLEDSSCHGCGVEHENGKKHHTAVAHRRICIDIFEVGLHACAECTVNYADTGEKQEYPCKLTCSPRHKIDCNAEAAITTKLHKHTCVKHRHGCWCRSMSVG